VTKYQEKEEVIFVISFLCSLQNTGPLDLVGNLKRLCRKQDL